MSKIESKIGKTPIHGNFARNYVVDDPSLESEQEESLVSNLSENWKRMSPEEYNQMRQELINKKTMHSTENVIPDNIGKTTINDDDKNLLNSFTNSNKTTNFEIKPEIKQENRMKNKIEILLGLKNKKAYKEIDGHVICLQNLTSEQTKMILEKMTSLNSSVDRLYVSKHMVLALSINAVDDDKIENILGENDSVENRMKIISNMDHDVVNELYDFYIKEIQQKIYSSTKEEAKEVSEEIKK